MTLLTPVSAQPRVVRSAPSGDYRQVLAVVELDSPEEPVIRQAVAESSARGVPLQVIVLHPRLPFTADPALLARVARRLAKEKQRLVAVVADAAQGSGLSAFEVRLVPLSRIPLTSRTGQARRTVAAQLRQQPSSLLVAPERLTRGARPTSVPPEPALAEERRHVETSGA